MQQEDGTKAIDTPTRSRARAETSHPQESSLRLVLLATVGFLLARLPMIPSRVFDPDELEHSHAAWCVFKGMLPYRDFFEHHTPWYYYTLRPLFHWFAVDTSFESARQFLWASRGLSFVLTIVSVFLVSQIGRLWADRRVGLVAGLLLVAQPVFLQKTLEMRPDVLALPFFLGGLLLLLRGISPAALTKPHRLGLFLGGGLALGGAIMCTQKMLFVLPGALAGLGLWALAELRAGKRLGGSSRGHGFLPRVLLAAMFVVGVAVPGVLTWAAFAHQGAGREFFANNFLLNAKWGHIPTGQLAGLLLTSGPALALCLAGVVVALHRFIASSAERDYQGILLAITVVALFVGVMVIPVAQRQYYLMPLPIVCLFAARASFVVMARIRQQAGRLLPWALVGLAALPIYGLCDSFVSRNDQQLERLQHVFESTRPTDVVMDGWEGTGVFRPHAFYYFFLHEESVLMLPREQVDSYVDELQSGKVHPRLIAMDKNLLALGPKFISFVKDNYTSRDGFLYFSRGDLLGLGPNNVDGAPSTPFPPRDAIGYNARP